MITVVPPRCPVRRRDVSGWTLGCARTGRGGGRAHTPRPAATFSSLFFLFFSLKTPSSSPKHAERAFRPPESSVTDGIAGDRARAASAGKFVTGARDSG
ncbi:hypothetical protein Q8A67_016882 [Cirrhinus molitorella]|uniref:Uncharacterized protein n=1 Tax=Cirrhinus molitorella TaxID=172907 RepID=A0AA88PKY2_9TELE|nr:hypothetical protein Q8A67_016882 [Cirrhinus molitorella]